MADRLLAEFGSEPELFAAIESMTERGYRRLDAYVPYLAPDIIEALEPRRSRLPWVVLAVGLAAAAGAYGLQWLVTAHLYPLDTGGRPAHFPLAFVLITFEMGVLFAAITAFAAVLIAGRLLRLVDEVQGTDGFESATRDGYWLEISTDDDRFDPERSRRELEQLGAKRIEPGGRP